MGRRGRQVSARVARAKSVAELKLAAQPALQLVVKKDRSVVQVYTEAKADQTPRSWQVEPENGARSGIRFRSASTDRNAMLKVGWTAKFRTKPCSHVSPRAHRSRHSLDTHAKRKTSKGTKPATWRVRGRATVCVSTVSWCARRGTMQRLELINESSSIPCLRLNALPNVLSQWLHGNVNQPVHVV